MLNSDKTLEKLTSYSPQEAMAGGQAASEGEPSNEACPEDKTRETFKKISISSVVQKWRQRVQNKQDILRQYRKRVSHQAHLAKILLATVVMFLICWAPFAIDACLHGAGYTAERPSGFPLVTQWMAFSNAICNPLIYSLLNARMRAAFKTLLEELWATVYTCKQVEDEVFEV